MSDPEPKIPSMDEIIRDLGYERMEFMHSMMTPDPDPDPSEGYHTELRDYEEGFQQWVRDNNIPFDDSVTSKYDLRGFYIWTPHPDVIHAAKTGQFPDKFKTPYDRTMPEDSIWTKTPSGNGPPHWEGNRLVDHEGEVVYEEPRI